MVGPVIIGEFLLILAFRSEAVSLFVGRPFQAVVLAKTARFGRPEKGVLHFFTASLRNKLGSARNEVRRPLGLLSSLCSGFHGGCCDSPRSVLSRSPVVSGAPTNGFLPRGRRIGPGVKRDIVQYVAGTLRVPSAKPQNALPFADYATWDVAASLLP